MCMCGALAMTPSKLNCTLFICTIFFLHILHRRPNVGRCTKYHIFFYLIYTLPFVKRRKKNKISTPNGPNIAIRGNELHIARVLAPKRVFYFAALPAADETLFSLCVCVSNQPWSQRTRVYKTIASPYFFV